MPRAARKPADPAPDAPAPADTQPPPEAPADPAPDADGEQEGGDTITRQNDSAWWCPYCDNSQPLAMQTCGNCGATRDGDTVTKAA